MNLFLIGSGFTKAVYPEAPLNSELLQELVRTNSKSVFAALQDRYGKSDVEVVLTRLDMDRLDERQQHGELGELRRLADAELAGFFRRYVAAPALLSRKPWLQTLITHVFSAGDIVVCLNYDPLLEGLLDCENKWTPNGGYGNAVRQLTVDMFDRGTPVSPVTVLKIHGSENFLIAPYADNPDSQSISFGLDESRFPVSGRGKHYRYGGEQAEHYLIAPSFVKVPALEITYLMLEALRATDVAQNLVVIGSGMRPEDTFLTVLMTALFNRPDGENRRAYIVDPKADEVCQRVYRFWGVPMQKRIQPLRCEVQHGVKCIRDVLG